MCKSLFLVAIVNRMVGEEGSGTVLHPARISGLRLFV